MPKRPLDDMVRVKKVTPVTVKEVVKPKLKPKKEVEEAREVTRKFEPIESYSDYKSNSYRYFLWLVALISIAFCFFAVSFLFSKANVLVNPKTEDVVLDENLSANKDSDANGLSFDTVTIPGQESTIVPATGEKNVSTPATGTVMIFNAFSSSPQNLDVDTRLEGSNGKIYKTQSKVVVPGMSKDGTPGQISVPIYGAAPGQEYNSPPLDFTILGFKGTPKYSKFTVRSQPGTQISGGFVGQAPDISTADKLTAVAQLKATLQSDLLQKATVQIPDGFILFKNAVFLSTDDSDLSFVYNNQNNTATLTLEGTLNGIILSEKELTKKIAENEIDKYDGSDVYIPKIKNLVFSMSTQTSVPTTTPSVTSATSGTQPDTSANDVSLPDLQNINFNLSGPAKIVWRLDVDKFTSDLLGKSKNDFTQILSQYPNVDSATLTLTPIWKISIPDQAKDVNVTVNYPN